MKTHRIKNEYCEHRNYALYIYSRNSRFSKVCLSYRTIEVLFTNIRKVDFFSSENENKFTFDLLESKQEM